jgi:hypothetical protein
MQSGSRKEREKHGYKAVNSVVIDMEINTFFKPWCGNELIVNVPTEV